MQTDNRRKLQGWSSARVFLAFVLAHVLQNCRDYTSRQFYIIYVSVRRALVVHDNSMYPLSSSSLEICMRCPVRCSLW